jgi:hypothetical protein
MRKAIRTASVPAKGKSASVDVDETAVAASNPMPKPASYALAKSFGFSGSFSTYLTVKVNKLLWLTSKLYQHLPNESGQLGEDKQDSIYSAAELALSKLGTLSQAQKALEWCNRLLQLRWQSPYLIPDRARRFLDELRHARVRLIFAVIVQATEDGGEVILWKFDAEVDELHLLQIFACGGSVDGHSE